ncbi:hypothetical protein ACX80S_18410 [Arthrobacter sp. RHLT1-20]
MKDSYAPTIVVMSGVMELAAGALSGWVHALATYNAARAKQIGIVSPPRIRQWHLDLIALGTGTIALGLAVPHAPRAVQGALIAGAWTNAMLFLPLAFRPSLIKNTPFRAVSLASFVSTSVGFTGMAIAGLSRRRAARL